MNINLRYNTIHALLNAIEYLAPNSIPVVVEHLDDVMADHLLLASEVEQAWSDVNASESRVRVLEGQLDEMRDRVAAYLDRAERAEMLAEHFGKQVEVLHDRLDNEQIVSQQSYLDQDMRAKLIESMADMNATVEHLRHLMGVES